MRCLDISFHGHLFHVSKFAFHFGSLHRFRPQLEKHAYLARRQTLKFSSVAKMFFPASVDRSPISHFGESFWRGTPQQPHLFALPCSLFRFSCVSVGGGRRQISPGETPAPTPKERRRRIVIRVGPICQTCQAARREREGADKTGRVCVGGRGSLVPFAQTPENRGG